ncbi:hypothetical protein [Pandoraea pulmonicola]|uniref:Uncharacterized protein n=1 Tax=Pandoraea pulmonicola TaxID=93221 RepID=A0ABM5RWJ5_PANPU|nr:hypothetical protein [Pandoraea pulmonicola]AJC19817.1 hypothetical protein RO07_03735 [Pandoraea pulmonicola]
MIVKEIHAQIDAQKKAHGEHGGKKWFENEGRCPGLAKKYDIKVDILRSCFNRRGELRAPGEAMVNGASKNEITIDILLRCDLLREEKMWPKGGLKAVADMFNVRSDGLGNYFLNGGTRTVPRGEARLKHVRSVIPVGPEEVQWLAQLKSHSQVG